MSLALVSALSLGACGGNSDDERCPEFEPIPPNPVAVVDIAGIDLFAVESRSLTGGNERYDLVAESDRVAAGDLLLSVASVAVPAAADGARSRPTPRLSCVGLDSPSIETNARLVDVALTSDTPWNDAYPAGSTLGNVVTVLEAPSLLPIEITDLPEYLDGVRFGAVLRGSSLGSESSTRLVNYLDDGPLVPFTLLLRLDPPDAERRHRFTVTYRTEDGDTFTASSAPITVAPRRAPPSVDGLAGTAWQLDSYVVRAADGALMETPVDGDGGSEVSGIEFDSQLSQMVVLIGGLGSCEFNIRVVDGTLEFLGSDRLEPYDPADRACLVDGGEPTEMQRFLERFWVSASYRLAIDVAERLTVTAPDGEQLTLTVPQRS